MGGDKSMCPLAKLWVKFVWFGLVWLSLVQFTGQRRSRRRIISVDYRRQRFSPFYLPLSLHLLASRTT